MKDVLVVKIGGNIIDDAEALSSFLTDLATITTPKILVHGGGKLATEMSAKLGIPTQMVEGRRITDDATIKVVTMTYAGWINKSIVAQLRANGCTAIGLSGADAGLLPAEKRPVQDIDYGWVGDLTNDWVNVSLLKQLFLVGLTVIVASITCDDNGHLLNVNADTVASVLAEALSEDFNTTLIFCFEKKGLLADVNNEDSVIASISEEQAKAMKADGSISKGMIPKIDNALRACANGVKAVMIGHAAQIKQLAKKQEGYGTRISA